MHALVMFPCRILYDIASPKYMQGPVYFHSLTSRKLDKACSAALTPQFQLRKVTTHVREALECLDVSKEPRLSARKRKLLSGE